MDILAPIAVVVFAWWFSTGAILYLVGMPRMTFPLSMGTATVAMGMSMFGLWAVGDDTSASGAYAGFLCALVIWAWNEIGFLTGAVTGPRTDDCPPGLSGWPRFWAATETVLYHEVAILGSVAFASLLTWGAPNRIGVFTLIVLWIARLSAKLNLYLGVANLTEELLPDHLAHLKSYFRRRPMNYLLPVSITVSSVATAVLAMLALSPGATAFETVGYAMVAALMGLVVIEHWFLVLPFSPATMWSWGMASRSGSVGAEPGSLASFDDREAGLEPCAGTATGLDMSAMMARRGA